MLHKRNTSASGNDLLLVIPHELIGEILFSNHNEPLSGHLGITKTLYKIKDRYFWDSLQRDVIKFVKGCPDCQARKGSGNRLPQGLLQPIPIGLPFSKVGIDVIGPFRITQKRKTVVVVATDYATRWVEAKALVNQKAEHIALFILENIICRHGCPVEFVTDRGTNFRSELVTNLCRIMGINNLFTTSYHPQCNGLTERCNQTIKDMLAMYTNTQQTDWDLYVPHVVFAYNTSRQDTTKMSPFMLVYGREPILPTDASLKLPVGNTDIIELRERALNVRSQAVENIRGKQIKDKTRYDTKHRRVEYLPGDKVKVFTPIKKIGKSEKLLLRYFGPYEIIEKKGEVDYLVKMGSRRDSREDIIHVSRILPDKNQ